MELTGRQDAFLRAFLELYERDHEPLHYSRVAERLGVSKITAYDMLRLLEDKGLLSSQYILPDDRRGAGRSSLAFHPSPQAKAIVKELVGENWEEREWEDTCQQMLSAVREGKARGYEGLITDILARAEQQSTPLLFAAEMATAVILLLRWVGGDVPQAALRERIQAMGFPGEMGLEALAGMAVGLSVAEDLNRKLTYQLAPHVQHFQQCLAMLDQHGRRRITELTQKVWRIVSA